jgi:PAS domain S-box-containing protein
MRFVAWRGLSDDYRAALDGHSPWHPGDLDPGPILIEDIETSEESRHVKDKVRAENIRSLAFIPLVSRRRVIGKFMSYYAEQHRFTPAETEIAITIARQLGFAIERQRAEEELRESEGRFRELSEEAPVMLWMSDSEGRCLHLNRLLRRFWGVPGDALDTFDWLDTMHPDDRPAVEAAMGEAILSRSYASVEGRYRNAAGQYRLLTTTARPRFGPNGQFLGMIGVNVDATEKREAELALRESEERLRMALAAGRMGTWRYDLKSGQQAWDDREYELMGVSPDVMPSRDLFLSLVHPRDLPAVAFQINSLPPDGTFLDSEFRIVRGDGSVRWLTAHSLTRHEAGVPVEMIGVNFDITEQKAAEERMRLLIAELNHRVKNTLAIVQSIAHQTFRPDVLPEAALRAFEGRLLALSGAHNLLTKTNWESASLVQIAKDALTAQGASETRFGLDGPPVQLPPRQALGLALAFHELTTNALKYGALSIPSGRIDLGWSRNGDRLLLEWMESGGPPVPSPGRRGFGSRLLERSLALDLEARVRLEFLPEGVRCIIDAAFPRADRPAEAAA